MLTFDQAVSKLRWTGVPLTDVVVGYFDRVEAGIVEVPLAEFLTSEVPHHRARHLRRGDETLWDRERRRRAVGRGEDHG